MGQIDHGFSRMVYVDVDTFPIEILLGETREVISTLALLVEDAKKKFPECTAFYFVPDGIDPRGAPAFNVSKRGSVPMGLIETNKADILAELLKSKHAMSEDLDSNFMGSLKLVGFRRETKKEIAERPQSVEERKAIEERELALYKRLKEKFENAGNNKKWDVCAVREE